MLQEADGSTHLQHYLRNKREKTCKDIEEVAANGNLPTEFIASLEDGMPYAINKDIFDCLISGYELLPHERAGLLQCIALDKESFHAEIDL